MMIWSFLFYFYVQAQQGKLPQKVIQFSNGIQIKVEMAETETQKSTGLMGRTELKEGEGMLFVFRPEQTLTFWMKNTLIPLSIGFLKSDKTLIDIQDMTPAYGPVRDESQPRYTSSRPAMYALEVPQGWFAKKKIRVGQKFRFINK